MLHEAGKKNSYQTKRSNQNGESEKTNRVGILAYHEPIKGGRMEYKVNIFKDMEFYNSTLDAYEVVEKKFTFTFRVTGKSIEFRSVEIDGDLASDDVFENVIEYLGTELLAAANSQLDVA